MDPQHTAAHRAIGTPTGPRQGLALGPPTGMGGPFAFQSQRKGEGVSAVIPSGSTREQPRGPNTDGAHDPFGAKNGPSGRYEQSASIGRDTGTEGPAGWRGWRPRQAATSLSSTASPYGSKQSILIAPRRSSTLSASKSVQQRPVKPPDRTRLVTTPSIRPGGRANPRPLPN